MDGEKVKLAARYVGTSTIVRSMKSAQALTGVTKEAGIADTAAAFGKRVLGLPKSTASFAMRSMRKAPEGLFSGGETFGRRLFNPRRGIQEGWRDMSGMASRRHQIERMVKNMDTPDVITEYAQRSRHLAPEANVGLREAWRQGRGKGVAEQLSRGGWTGEGKYTKYLPVGNKGMMAGFGAAEIPGIVNAPAASPTGEGGRLERTGGLLGGTAGWMAGAGKMGVLPSMALWYAGSKAGTTAGRIADRLRAGGSVGQAFTAPSPEEARAQLGKIYQTYGG